MLALYRMELMYERVKYECNHNYWKSLSSRQQIFSEMQAVLPKRWYKSTKLHGVSFHKSIIFIATNVRTSNLIQQNPVHVSNHCKCIYQLIQQIFYWKITDKLTAKYQNIDLLYKTKIYLKLLYMELICRNY
jgi:hypothetical protein